MPGTGDALVPGWRRKRLTRASVTQRAVNP